MYYIMSLNFFFYISGGVCHARQKEASPLPVAAALEAEYQAVIMSLIVHQELVGTAAVKMAADTLYVLSLLRIYENQILFIRYLTTIYFQYKVNDMMSLHVLIYFIPKILSLS